MSIKEGCAIGREQVEARDVPLVLGLKMCAVDCDKLPAEYCFDSEHDALKYIKNTTQNQHASLHNRQPSLDGPCCDGEHVNVRYMGRRIASITSCPCIDAVGQMTLYRVHW